jgi:hypothetical protein
MNMKVTGPRIGIFAAVLVVIVIATIYAASSTIDGIARLHH